MRKFYFSVILLAGMASSQIVPYTGPIYTGPVGSNGIYGSYGPYGPYGKFDPYGPYGPGNFYGGIISGPYGIYGPSGIHPSTYNSFYNQVQQRVNAYTSPANTILANTVSNFQICGKTYLKVPDIETYNSCMSTHVNKALRDISVLESKAKTPCNTEDN